MDTASRLQGAVQSITSIFSRKTKETAAPRLSNPVRYPFGEFEFHLHAAAGQAIELQVTRDFKTWETLDRITPGQDASAVSDKRAGSYPALFYRAVAGETRSNYLGFVTFEIPHGYSMVTNPLHAACNQIAELFPMIPGGSSISKLDPATSSLVKNRFAQGKWSNPAEALIPGEGALFHNPGSEPIYARFVGEVPQTEQELTVQPGTSMRSSLLPLAGRLDTDLGFPIEPGDIVSIYCNHRQHYEELKFTEAGWQSAPPVLALGEAFWVAKNSPGLWKQKLPGA